MAPWASPTRSASMPADAPLFRTKRRYLVCGVIKTTVSPDCEVVVSVLSWSENNEIPRLTPTV